MNGGSECVKQLQGFREHSTTEEESSKEKIESYIWDLFSYYRALEMLLRSYPSKPWKFGWAGQLSKVPTIKV